MSPLMLMACITGLLAAVCLVAAVRHWRFPFAAKPDPVEPDRVRKGIVNMPGGRASIRGAKYGPDLDVHVENHGKLREEDSDHQ